MGKKVAYGSVNLVNINDGIQYYNWVVYASSLTPPPSDISDDPTGKTYVGFAYNKTTSTWSTNYNDYQWMGLNGGGIKELRLIYYMSTHTESEYIPLPSDSVQGLYANGYVNSGQGVIAVNAKTQWGYDKPEFENGYHLWTSTEIVFNEGTSVFSDPVLSAEWELFYNMNIGGTNLIRNSKTLIDEYINWL